MTDLGIPAADLYERRAQQQPIPGEAARCYDVAMWRMSSLALLLFLCSSSGVAQIQQEAATAATPERSGGGAPAADLLGSPAEPCIDGWVPTFGSVPSMDGVVRAQVVFDDSQGPALFVAGEFGIAGEVAAFGIARWDGSAWSPLGCGLAGGVSPAVHALTVFDDGSGPDLYAGGAFTSAGGSLAVRTARWDETSWSLLAGLNDTVLVLGVFDGGSGPELYARGRFTSAAGTLMDRIERWDGGSWSSLGSELRAAATSSALPPAARSGSSAAAPSAAASPSIGSATLPSGARSARRWTAFGSSWRFQTKRAAGSDAAPRPKTRTARRTPMGRARAFGRGRGRLHSLRCAQRAPPGQGLRDRGPSDVRKGQEGRPPRG